MAFLVDRPQFWNPILVDYMRCSAAELCKTLKHHLRLVLADGLHHCKDARDSRRFGTPAWWQILPRLGLWCASFPASISAPSIVIWSPRAMPSAIPSLMPRGRGFARCFRHQYWLVKWTLQRFVGAELLRSGCCLLLPHLPRLQADVVDLLLNRRQRHTLLDEQTGFCSRL